MYVQRYSNLLVSLLVCFNGVAALWPATGGNLYRTNTISAALPNADTGINIVKTATPPDPNPVLLPPLLSTAVKGVTTTILTDSKNCAVTFWDDDFNLLGRWACPGDTITAAPALDATGTILVVATTAGGVYAVSVPSMTQLWGPVKLQATVANDLIVIGSAAWIVDNNGIGYLVNTASGAVTKTPEVTCGSSRDVLSSSFTQLWPMGPTAVASTVRGCVVAINVQGFLEWNSSSLTGGALFVNTLPPAVDYPSKQLYVTTKAGLVCCLTIQGSFPCDNWGGRCVTLPVQAPLVGGVAVGPNNLAFHSGQVFVFDADGFLYTVFAQSGANVSSENSLGLDPVTAAPVVVPNALGNDINVMVVVTSTGILKAIYVGDAPVTDDDSSSDDNGYGNDGVAWSLPLGSNITRAVRSGAPSVIAAGIAVGVDGCIYVPLANGQLVVVGPQHAPSDAPDTQIIIVVTVIVVVAVVAIGISAWCAIRHRRRVKQAKRDAALLGLDEDYISMAELNAPQQL